MSYLTKSIDFVDTTFGVKRPHFDRTLYWVKYLKPDADEALQIAAYCHDVERGFNLNRQRRLMYDTEEELTNHQIRSSKIMYDFLIKNGAPEELAKKVRNLILKHETGGTDEQNTLNDSDSISYLEVNALRNLSLIDILPEGEVGRKFDLSFKRIISEEAKIIAQPMYKKAKEMLKIAERDQNGR